jgi:hypothetical protein
MALQEARGWDRKRYRPLVSCRIHQQEIAAPLLDIYLIESLRKSGSEKRTDRYCQYSLCAINHAIGSIPFDRYTCK